MLLSTSAACLFAQSSLIATLSHDGEITAFYGVNALKEAHEAAVHGDAITLSSGLFNATDITKAITLRGASMQLDTINQILPTEISGNFTINVADSVPDKLTIESIYHNHQITVKGTLKEARFIKNRLKELTCSSATDGALSNCNFIHCKIVGSFQVTPSGTDCIVSNSYIYRFGYVNNGNSGSAMSFSNCILKSYVYTNNSSSTNDWIGEFYKCSFVNCVLIGNNFANNFNIHPDRLPSNATAYNCVAINCYQNSCFTNIPNTTNTSSTYAALFKDFTGTYNDDITFELTEEAKTKFLGTDGTQVGIYGGNFPYSPISTNPRITKCNVAAKSTADGKLSVDIEVAGAE